MMNNKHTPYDDELRQLFHELPKRQVSESFSARVMAQIVVEAPQYAKQRRRFFIFSICMAILAGLAIIGCTLYFTGTYKLVFDFFSSIFSMFDTVDISFTDSFQGFTVTPVKITILIGVAVLFLLLGDLLIRQGIKRKKMA